MITHYNGDLLTSGADYICHQVNCRGVMGSGIAKTIKEKYPRVYEEYIKCGKDASWDYMYGHCQAVLVNQTWFVNMFAQDGYGYQPNIRYTSYDAFWNCLIELKAIVPKDKKIAFPYNIGCCRGGASWAVIETMIAEVLGDYDVEIWRLDNG